MISDVQVQRDIDKDVILVLSKRMPSDEHRPAVIRFRCHPDPILMNAYESVDRKPMVFL